MGKKSLNELDSAELLSSAGINMVKSVVLTEGSDATLKQTAEDLGFPVVMKVLSDDILHKTDLGCVCLGIHSVEGMHEAYETILENARKNAPSARVQGVVVQQMLPKGFEVLMVGLGGIYVELLKAVSMRMVPISRADAEQMIDETPLKMVCKGLRGVHYNREEIVEPLLNLSNLCQKRPEIREVDVNPFILYGDRKATAVDAMVILED